MKKTTDRPVDSSDRPLIVYHQSAVSTCCDDGFAAAFAAWLHFGDRADYCPAIHGQPIIDLSCFTDREVYFLDFAYPIETMDEIAARARNLTVLDHHHSVIAEAGDRAAFAGSTKAHSGAILAWRHFCDSGENSELPLLFRHIEDSDLWRHNMAETAPFIARLRLEPYDFAHWQKLLSRLHRPDSAVYRGFVEEGELLCRQTVIQCDQLMSAAFEVELTGVIGLAVNATRFYASELGERLARQSGTFAAIFVVLPEGLIDVGLRSASDECDVSAIAKHYGGGGHRRAAGFRTKDSTLFLPMG